MVLRAVAVGFACLLVLGCARTAPIVAPTVVVVGGVSGAGLGVSSAEPDYGTIWKAKEEVEVEWLGIWWPAVVLEKRGGRWLVHYEGYAAEWDEVVSGDRLRERRAEPEIDDSSEMDDESEP